MEEVKCGVYKITNTINGKFYIGSSINIKKRWKSHIFSRNNKKSCHLELYKDFNKYGIDCFEFEILEECSKDILLEKEYEYIKSLKAVEKGYNAQGLEKHPNHKLTIEDVIDIRTRYNNLENKNDVFFDYEDRINHTGFHKIWHGYTWKEIMPEIFSIENKEWHYKNGQSRPGEQNGRTKLTTNDVINIRTRKANGESLSEVFEDYKNILRKGGFNSIWYNKTWKNIKV